MPDLIKVGKTRTSVEDRIKSLDTTGVSLPFQCVYSCFVANCDLVERKIHHAFGDHRVRNNREFFKLSFERVISILELVAIEETTPKTDVVNDVEDLVALEKFKKPRSRFKFSLVNIPIGSTLYFSKDNNIIATVKSDNTILYNNEEISLSLSAQNILKAMGYNWVAVQGPSFWMYKDKIDSPLESLHDLRLEREMAKDSLESIE